MPRPLIDVPEHRAEALARIAGMLDRADRIALTTHVNADGDGAGSEAALAIWLTARGKQVRIVNPTGFPDLYRYLIPDAGWLVEPGDGRSEAAAKDAALFVVLDTSEPRRIGRIAPLLRGLPVAMLDHHPPTDAGIEADEALQDPDACATGELVFDLLRAVDGDAAWPDGVAEAIYAAVVTDTGSFRYANTTPRTHAIAAELLRRGVDPEASYRHLFGTVPFKRIRLLRAALERLETDPALPIAWITIPKKVMKECGATSEDLEGVVEHARSIEGTEVALLFRETGEGGTKVSLRSNGRVDVNAIARAFGGGGHVKASGILMNASLERARREVLDATRDAVRALDGGPEDA